MSLISQMMAAFGVNALPVFDGWLGAGGKRGSIKSRPGQGNRGRAGVVGRVAWDAERGMCSGVKVRNVALVAIKDIKDAKRNKGIKCKSFYASVSGSKKK